MEALYAGDRTRAEELLPSDSDLDVFHAAAFGRESRLGALLDADPALARAWSPDGFTPLHLAAFTDEAGTARLLVERGAHLEDPSRHEQIRGVRPLNTAAFAGARSVARVLLESGADPNSTAEGGFTPLHSAAQNGDADVVRLLLESGADASARADDGRTPADLAEGDVAELLRP